MEQTVKIPDPQNPMVVRASQGLTIVGTRITLYNIMDYLKDDWPPHLIKHWFNLTDPQLAGALDYIENHREEVEAEYEQVLREAEEIRRYWEARNREHFARIAALPPKPGQEAIRAKLQERKARRQAE